MSNKKVYSIFAAKNVELVEISAGYTNALPGYRDYADGNHVPVCHDKNGRLALPEHVLSADNSKVACFSFNMLPVITCKQDCNGCYAKKSLMYPATVNLWSHNTWLAQHCLSRLKVYLMHEIGVRYNKGDRDFRIHTSGDFIHMEYFKMWVDIVRYFKEMQFWTYTKNRDIFRAYESMPGIENLNIVNSWLPDGQHNYGSAEWCKQMHAFYKFPICPYRKGNGIKCVRDCNLCQVSEQVLFVQH